jgi:excisionase family DNA binding protein
MADDQLWRVERLAEYLSTSVANCYYLISNDRIPGVVRLGPRMIRIDPDAVRAWIAEGGFAWVAS